MSRVKRTQQFRKTVEKEWILKYWAFIQENPDKMWDWSDLSEKVFAKQREDIYNEIYEDCKQKQKTHFLENIQWELYAVAMHPDRYHQFM